MRRCPRPHRRPPGGLRRPAIAALVAVTLLASAALVPVVAAGCGGSPTGVAHYRSAAYRFSLAVDRRLTEWRSATTASGTAFEVSFVDTRGTIVDGRHLDALTVSVVDTATSPTSAEAAQLSASLPKLGAAMVAKMGPDAQTGTVSAVSLNGLSGVVVPFSVTLSGVRQIGWLYLFADSGRIYALTAAASAAQWTAHRPLFERAIDSFTVG